MVFILYETVGADDGRGREAHIVVSAPSEDALAEWMLLVENLRFDAGD